ncbi:WYL domain-containing protein [Pseudoalteromonas sp. Hal040]|uniref:WYL domain-containing protein n=1 Tax=unclassified Pseudoalteromonas TaxID=194690 RepID=UPI00301C1E98
MSHSQRERLAFIDFNLEFLGQIARAELIQKFGIGPASCTRDFALYKELAPGNAVLMHENKRYVRSEAFRAVFEHNPTNALKALVNGSSGEISQVRDASQFCFDTVQLGQPTTEVISAITRAIFSKSVVACHYESLSCGLVKGQIVPHAVFSDGLRWYVRAFDRKNKSFKSYTLTRFIKIELVNSPLKSTESVDLDINWNSFCELELIPHPKLVYPKAIELDYGMNSGSMKLKVRAVFVSFLLKAWNIDYQSNSNCINLNKTLYLSNYDSVKEYIELRND